MEVNDWYKANSSNFYVIIDSIENSRVGYTAITLENRRAISTWLNKELLVGSINLYYTKVNSKLVKILYGN